VRAAPLARARVCRRIETLANARDQGFRSMGFHERQVQSAEAPALPLEVPQAQRKRRRARKTLRATSSEDLRRAELTAGVITPSVSPVHWADEDAESDEVL